MISLEAFDKLLVGAANDGALINLMDSTIEGFIEARGNSQHPIERARLSRSSLPRPIKDWILCDPNVSPTIYLQNNGVLRLAFSSDERQLRDISVVGENRRRPRFRVEVYPS